MRFFFKGGYKPRGHGWGTGVSRVIEQDTFVPRRPTGGGSGWSYRDYAQKAYAAEYQAGYVRPGSRPYSKPVWQRSFPPRVYGAGRYSFEPFKTVHPFRPGTAFGVKKQLLLGTLFFGAAPASQVRGPVPLRSGVVGSVLPSRVGVAALAARLGLSAAIAPSARSAGKVGFSSVWVPPSLKPKAKSATVAGVRCKERPSSRAAGFAAASGGGNPERKPFVPWCDDLRPSPRVVD